MSESNPKDANQNQSLQNQAKPAAPDPASGPISVAAVPVLQTLSTVGLTVIGGGAALIFAGAMLTPALGATRSARLSQGQRRQEIAEAILQVNAEELRPSGSPHYTDPVQ